MNNALLEINNLCVDYVSPNGIARAVNEISLSIKPGETLGIAGLRSGWCRTVPWIE